MMDVRSLGYRTDLMLRQLAGASIEARDSYLVVRTPANPTFYWGNFLLFRSAPAPGDPKRWLELFAAEFPHAQHVSIGVDGVDGALGAAEEMRSLGLAEETSIVLTAERLTVPTVVAPQVDVRKLGTDEEWAQSVEFRIAVDEDASAGHRMFVERRAQELRALAVAGHGVYVGAFVDGVARAGLGLYAASRLARYQSVETHPHFRRRGLATALLIEADRLVRARQAVERLVIVADPDYVAIDLYRRLGFRDTERQVQWLRLPNLSA